MQIQKGITTQRNLPNRYSCRGQFVTAMTSDSVSSCIMECSLNDHCEWYTFDQEHGFCVLFEDCNESVKCEKCISGERNCVIGLEGTSKGMGRGGKRVRIHTIIAFVHLHINLQIASSYGVDTTRHSQEGGRHHR